MQKSHIVLGCLAIAGLGMFACSSTHTPEEDRAPVSNIYPRRVKPNIVMLMLDDVGFGHLSPFGGPIPTPNIDRVAKRGLRYTNFHTTAMCSPSRAAFLTGRNHHSVGTGKITELASDEAGYTGRIPKSAATFAQILHQAGYSTYAVGKWHNTPASDVTPNGPYDLWPRALGFQNFYGFIGAAANQWAPALWADKRSVDPGAFSENYILDRDLGDHAVRYIDEMDEDGAPFVLYLAPGSGHAPHQAPKDFIDRNKGHFDQGWDAVREETLLRQKDMGIMPKDAQLPPRPDVIPAWSSLSADEKRLFARMEEVHAGAIEQSDAQFGRVLDKLEETGMIDNTIVIVTSDNGASGEGGLLGTANEMRVANGLPERLDIGAIDDLGSHKTFENYPAGWALAGNTPGQYWKQTVHEGGIRDPFIISWPKGIAARNELRSQFTHIVDVAPTLLEVAGVEAPAEVDHVKQMPLEGKSFASTFENASAPTTRDVQYFEMFGNRGVWANGWKAVAFHGRWPWDTKTESDHFERDRWELYNLDADPNETVDLAASAPEKLAELQTTFDEQARAHNVFPLDDSTSSLLDQNVKRLLDDRREFNYNGWTRATPEVLSPPVKNRSHTIVAKLRAPSDVPLEGVIVACGGRFGGYSLYVKHNKLFYAHNYVGDARYVIESTDTIKPGERVLRFELEKTGENTGKGRLFIDDVPSGEGDIPHTVPIVYSLNETFDTGQDTGTAVGDYRAPFEITGRLHSVTFTLDVPKEKTHSGSSRTTHTGTAMDLDGVDDD